jgi:hypothetical protein
MEEVGEDSMTCEGNARMEEEMEVMVKDVTGTLLLLQLQRQVSAFKTLQVRFISFTVDTLYKLHAAVFLLRS